MDDHLKPWLLEVTHSPALSLGCSMDVSVERKPIRDTTALIYFHSLRNERKARGGPARGNPSVPPAGFGQGLGDACSPLPWGSLLPFMSRTLTEDKPALKKAVRVHPENQPAAQPGDMVNRKDVLLSTREPPQNQTKVQGQGPRARPACRSFCRLPTRPAPPRGTRRTAAKCQTPKQATSFSFFLSMKLLLGHLGMG